ncbi:MAG TPA: MFS transporter [Dongiaceae bacterium]|jgi:MFS family permease|nr:MFS transporter [Dongiaceae bacterium]
MKTDRALSEPARLRELTLAMSTGFFDGLIFQTLLVFLPIYALRLGAGEDRAIQYLTVCMLGGIPLQLLIGSLLDRIGSEAVLVLACGIIAALLPCLAWMIEQGPRDRPGALVVRSGRAQPGLSLPARCWPYMKLS